MLLSFMSAMSVTAWSTDATGVSMTAVMTLPRSQPVIVSDAERSHTVDQQAGLVGRKVPFGAQGRCQPDEAEAEMRRLHPLIHRGFTRR